MSDAITATVHKPTGIFLDSARADDATHITVALPRNPDHVRERYSGNSQDPLRAATAQEIADAKDAALQTEATVSSREKDVLATVAFVVRASNVSAWNAMTVAQKKTATLAQADNWRDIRVWIEKNL